MTYQTTQTTPYANVVSPYANVVSPDPPDQLRGLYWECHYHMRLNEELSQQVFSETELSDQDAIALAVSLGYIPGDKAEYRVISRDFDPTTGLYNFQVHGFNRAAEMMYLGIYHIAHIEDLPAGFDAMVGAEREAAILAYADSIGFLIRPND